MPKSSSVPRTSPRNCFFTLPKASSLSEKSMFEATRRSSCICSGTYLRAILTLDLTDFSLAGRVFRDGLRSRFELWNFLLSFLGPKPPPAPIFEIWNISFI